MKATVQATRLTASKPRHSSLCHSSTSSSVSVTSVSSPSFVRSLFTDALSFYRPVILLPPPGGIVIRRVVSFVSVFVRSPAVMAGVRRAGVRQAVGRAAHACRRWRHTSAFSSYFMELILILTFFSTNHPSLL